MYQYARHLEANGDSIEAIKAYEEACTHHREVPRMLFETGQFEALESYINSAEDAKLFAWWAQYCESKGQLDQALQYYRRAGQIHHQVRVMCFQGKFDAAAELCHKTEDAHAAAAAFHLARQYESREMIHEAIRFYNKAKLFHHGARLAMENGLDNELMGMALESSNAQLRLEAARHFDKSGDADRAVLLYQKGGNLGRALELAEQTGQYDSLRHLAEELDAETADPALLSRCADFFIGNEQFDKAAAMLVSAKRLQEALDMCVQHAVHVSEDMAEKMTPPKPDNNDMEARKERAAFLKQLAKLCRNQGSYHLACKKYTQAGDKVRAMQCLLKSNDTEKIIYYAGLTKKREMYILAANYLQNLDWPNDPKLLETIVTFYTKARAMEQLSLFYDSFAQIEIDEHRNYDKALEVLEEALKCMIKAKDAPDREAKMSLLEERINLVRVFVQARQQGDVGMFNSLLSAPNVEAAVRLGDIYAVMVEMYYNSGMMSDAYSVLDRMKQEGIVIAPFVDDGIARAVYEGLGMDPEEAMREDARQHQQYPQYDGGSGMDDQVGGIEGDYGGMGDGYDDEIGEEIPEEFVDTA